MKFHIEKHGSVPVARQIQQQIKLSIAIGVLKAGVILPSIRDIEEQTDINHGRIHRAYLALRQSDLLSPAPGKRTAVAITAVALNPMNHKCQQRSRDVLIQIQGIGVPPNLFDHHFAA